MQNQSKEPDSTRSSGWVLHITDNHLFTDPNEEKFGINSRDSLRQVLEKATDDRRPELIVDTGDVASDSTSEIYELFCSIVREYVDCPVMATPGNHDLSKPFEEWLSSDSNEVNDWRVVAVDTHLDDSLGGFVDVARLEKLTEELAAHKQPTLVVGHHPAQEIGCPWIDAHRVLNGEQLLSTLANHSHVKGYLSGHVHQQFEGQSHGLKLMSTPSTCWQFAERSERFGVDELPPGWRWLELQADGSIASNVYRLDSK